MRSSHRRSTALVSGGLLLLASCFNDLDGYSGGGAPDAGPAPAADAGHAADGADSGLSGAFTDEHLDGEFGAGTFVGTRWVGDHVELEAGARQGTFVSRVFDSGSDGARWTTLGWVPGAPYGKPLPDGAAAEAGYREASFDMAKNVLLAHFDGGLVDTSPAANAIAGSGISFADGVFGQALVDTQASYVSAKVVDAKSVFDFGTDSVSWSIWAKSTAPCPGNAVYMGIENPGTGLKPHMWLGCTPLGGANGPGTLGDTFCSIRTTSDDCVSVTGASAITDGAWHHLAIVKDGHASATVSAYLDGVLQGAQPNAFLDPIAFDDGVEFAIGAFSQGTYPAEGTFDEVAVFRRALSADEVAALYRRGALRLSVAVRACAEPTCQGVPFVGPAAAPARGFVDPPGSPGPPSALPIALTGRYAQYELHLESDAPDRSPKLYAVALGRAP